MKTLIVLFFAIMLGTVAFAQNKTYRLVASQHHLYAEDGTPFLDAHYQYTYNNKGYVSKINNIKYEYDEQGRLVAWDNTDPKVKANSKYTYAQDKVEQIHSDAPDHVRTYKTDAKSRIISDSNGSFETNYAYNANDELESNTSMLGGSLSFEYHENVPLPNPWVKNNNALLAQSSFGFFDDSLYSINPFGANHHSKLNYKTPDNGTETITYNIMEKNVGGYPTKVNVTHTKVDSLGNTINYTGEFAYEYEEVD